MAADETDYLDGGVGGRYSLNFRTMDIHITRNGEQHNTYPEATARQFLEEGKLLSTDLACYAGADGWKPLSEVLEVSAQSSATTSPNTPDVQKMITDKETVSRKGNDLNRASRSDMRAPLARQLMKAALPNALDPHSQHIYITLDGKEFGPYDADRTRDALQQRHLLPSDYAWFEGLSDWTPLSEIIVAIPEPAVSRQPWCGKCKSYTEYRRTTTSSRGGGGGGMYTNCKVCGRGMLSPAENLHKLKVVGVIFLISVVAIPCMLIASANSWRVALLLEMVNLIKPCVIVAVLSPFCALLSAYRYLKWYVWKRKCATDLHR